MIRASSALFLLLASACNAKAQQCNRFTDAVAEHKRAIAAAVEQLGNIRNDPAVADAFSQQVATARERIGGLDLSDETVAGFAKQFVDLLGEADQVNRDLATAAAAHDDAGVDRAARAAAALAPREQAIVDGVNEYCQK